MVPRLLPSLALLLFMLGASRSDVASDQAQCTDQLVGLATCLPYVQGAAKAPTPDCCSGLKGVLSKSPKCLCILVKDRDDPRLGIQINATLALSLPSRCAAPANISECPKLLNLPPNSKDAQVFEQFGSGAAAQGNATTVKGNGSGSVAAAAQASNNGGSGRGGFLWGEVVAVGMGVLLPLVAVVLNG